MEFYCIDLFYFIKINEEFVFWKKKNLMMITDRIYLYLCFSIGMASYTRTIIFKWRFRWFDLLLAYRVKSIVE
jgi:hypothetical protein